MKKVIFKKFILILSLALIISGSIFSVTISNIIFDKTRENMIDILRIADYAIDYTKDLKPQLDHLKEINTKKELRFSLFSQSGDVIADSNLSDLIEVKNHSDREEIKEALEYELGDARRESETLGRSFLYVSMMSENSPYILRMAVPFTGLIDYIGLLLPAVLVSIGISLLVSMFLADGFARSITKPLYEISEELLKLKEENPEFNFKRYRYSEMNLIADTTEHMAEAVQESKKQIEFEKMIRQEFFSNVSHELKTPITSVRGYAELLENDMARNLSMNKEFIYRIKKETENMTNLINDILMISRLETKEVEVTHEMVRLAPLVDEVCKSIEPLAKECQVKIITNCRPLSMEANTAQLRELLNNLITNAVKYNKPEGKVFVTVTAEAKNIVIMVEDTGMGIPEDSMQRVFERFYRVDKGRSKKMGGTGLGLSIVKHVVNYYEGSIELDSKVGIGSKFIVRLPKQSSDQKNQPI